jgi:hypothetical protein
MREIAASAEAMMKQFRGEAQGQMSQEGCGFLQQIGD